jgi:Flp pilus assembly protein TadD
VLANAGELAAAVELLREALRLDPDLPGLHGELASLFSRLGRIPEANYHAAEAGRRQ